MAERLASILNALGLKAEAKKRSNAWFIELATGSIVAIRRREWVEALRAYVEELYRHKVIDEKKRERLLKEIERGPKKVEIAGVEFNVRAKKSRGSRYLEIVCEPVSDHTFYDSVDKLKKAGFIEGIHFTVMKPEGGASGRIYLKPEALRLLSKQAEKGDLEAKRAIEDLRRVAKAWNFEDLLERYIPGG